MTAWAPSRVDHDSVLGDCATCHDGRTAEGRPFGHPTHVRSTNVCEACHRPGCWSLIGFDHTQVLGSRSTCHDGATATGKPPGHFQTARECDLCHLTQDWQPIVFRHMSPTYPGDHSGPPRACHQYTDPTFTTIERSRTGEHRPGSGAF